MPRMRHTREEIVSKLRQVDCPDRTREDTGQGREGQQEDEALSAEWAA